MKTASTQRTFDELHLQAFQDPRKIRGAAFGRLADGSWFHGCLQDVHADRFVISDQGEPRAILRSDVTHFVARLNT